MNLSRRFDPAADPAELEAAPRSPGVILAELESGRPYVGKTHDLNRRLRRLLRIDSFRRAAVEIRYEPVGSPFEALLLLYETLAEIDPEGCRERLRLRPAPFVKLHLENPFPRTSVTTRLSGSRALFYGPFRSRATAEEFENAVLDHFLTRRCVENLEPDPNHPGCVYGEIGKCLRPCRQEVDAAEYRAESGRLLRALNTRGASLIRDLESERDEASAELEFERAARLHERLRLAVEAFRVGEDLARDLDEQFGVVVQRSAVEGAAELWPIRRGFLQPRIRLEIEAGRERPVSLDRRAREALESGERREESARERTDHQALLRRWRFSSWKVGELVMFDDPDAPPIRRVVNAVSRVLRGAPGSASNAPDGRPSRLEGLGAD